MRRSLKFLITFLCCICLWGCGAKEGSDGTMGNAEDYSQSVEKNDDQNKVVETDGVEESAEASESVAETEAQSTEQVETEPEESKEEKVYLMTQCKSYSDGVLSGEEYYEYDGHGNRTVYKDTSYIYEGITLTTTETNEYTYDDQGRIVKQISMNIGVDIFTNETIVTGGWEYTHEYDEYGNEVGYCEKMYSPYDDSWVDSYSEKYVMEYNDSDQMIKKSVLGNDGTIRRWIEWEYNEKGVLIKETNYDGDGTMSSYTIYDNAGRMLEDITGHWYDVDNILYQESLVNKEYDDKGNCVKETEIYHELESDTKTVYEMYVRQYDSDDNMVKEERYSKGDTLTEWHEYQYDSDGNMIKDQYYDAENVAYNRTYEYQYDEAGNKIREDHYNGEGELTFYIEYEYVEHVKSTSN